MATALGLVLLFSFKTPDSPTDSSLPLAVANGTPAQVATAPSAQPPTSGNQQVDGDVIPTQFGDIQVRVVESGGKIVDVKALQLPSDRRRSREISQYSEPILHDEALQAQSAQIDTVSGATYTSEAYRESLQSALDHANG